MTYPPQGQPSDPYGQSQQPGGYLPGQAGPGYQPQYTQPDTAGYASQPGYGQQPGYAPPPGYGQQPGYPDPYGQYGPPPAPPKRGGGIAILIVVVLILMIGGGVAGYLLLGDDEGATTTAGDETTSAAPEDDTEDTEQAPEEDQTDGMPGGELVVASLGAVTPQPSDPWEPDAGPGEAGRMSSDAQTMIVHHTDTWISAMAVGLFEAAYTPYDAAALEGTASAAMDTWTAGFADGATGLVVDDTELTEVEVDGRPGVLAETQVSWDSYGDVEDTYEDIAMLVVDVDGVNGFFSLVSVPQTGIEEYPELYDGTVEGVLATTFDAESA